jgi:arylsulfatase A-like enzyme
MQSSYWEAHQESWTEVLARNGYNTFLFPAHRLPMLRRYVKGVNVVEEARGKRLDKTIDLAIKTLAEAPADQPFLAYIYIPDPHSPYKSHGNFDFGPLPMDDYDGEIAHTDHHLGRLFDWMDKAGRLDDTMVVIMSDHGESFGERMVYRHSSQLYNDQTHIPAIVYVPAVGTRRVSDYISSIDLGPTILNAVGIDIPESYLGVTLMPLMKGEPFIHPSVYGEESYRPSDFPNLRPEENPQEVISKYMVITQDGYKLIYNRSFYTFELYDLKRDLLEEKNLYNLQPEKAGELREKLGRFVDIVLVSRPWDADESRFFFGRDENREPWIKGDY